MSFKGLNLSEKMLSSLSRQGFFNPSLIQLRVIPKALKKETLLVQSETGSGKTLCFLIPIIENINTDIHETQAIIVTPTRELAEQVFACATAFNKEFDKIKIRLFKSGEERENSLKGLSVPPHIIIGTPGRLADILSDNKNLNLSHVQTVVFDEADMLLSEGYFNEIDKFMINILNTQFLSFSATLESNLSYQLQKYVGSNIAIINEEIMTSHNVKHYLINTKHNDLNLCVKRFIDIVKPYLLLIFASKKETANNIYSYLRSEKYKVGLLTGDLNTRERKNVLKRLMLEQFYILVCSDMAARGLDIPNVSDVLNIDLPNNLEFYYHRAGRTGRFDKSGNCYTFYDNDSTKKPLALISNGVNFEYLCFKDDQLLNDKPIEKQIKKSKKINEDLMKEIRKINNISYSKKNSKVKPGYKKKKQQAINKAKQKFKRELIKKDIRRQRVERYKKEGQHDR